MSDLHDAIERAIKDHCSGGDLWLCAHIASEPFDARVAGLYEENVQLRDSVTIRDTEIARLETDLELARRDGERYRFVRMMNPREFSAMWTRTMVTCAQFDELIDEARAGNGGEV